MKLLWDVLNHLVNVKSSKSKSQFRTFKKIHKVKFHIFVIFYRAMDEHQWKVVSELFAKNDPIGKLINECQMIKDLDFKEGIKCDQDAVLNTTEE